MASLVLSGDTSGSITVAAPAVAGSNTQTLVATTGTLAPIVSGTAITLTNQTAPDFTSIPSWVKRITLMFNGVSTNSTGNILIQLGDAGGYETTGYASGAGYGVAGGQFVNSTSGFILDPSASASALRSGSMIISLLGSNTWVSQSCVYSSTATTSVSGGGAKTLSDTLTSVRLFVDGTQQFDAGTINILYE